MTFDVVQKPVGTLDFLLLLRRRGPQNMTAVLTETGVARDTFYEAVERLKALGFVYEEERAGFPQRKFYGLTRAGETFADRLGPAAEFLATTAISLETELSRLDEANEPSSTPRRLEILDVIGAREFALGRWQSAEVAGRRLVDLAASTNDTVRLARGRLLLGKILQKRDLHDEGIRELEEARRLAESGAAWEVAAEADYLIGSDLERRGRWPESLVRFGSVATHAARGESPLWAARSRLGRARVLSRQGQHSDALFLFMEGISEFQRLRAEDDLPRAYASLGSAAYLANRPDALEWWEKAVDAARKSADVRTEAYALASAAAQLIDRKDFRRAEAHLSRARDVFISLDEKTGLGTAELNFANLSAAQGRWAEAENRFDEAARVAHEAGNRFQEASVLFNRGQMMKRRDRRGEARGLLGQAKGIFEEIGAAARAARCDEELRDLT